MAFEQLSSIGSLLSLDSLAINDTSFIISLIYFAISIVIYSIIIWHFYRFIAKRDCFKIKSIKHPKAVGFLKYFFGFPFVASLFFLGFSLMMLALTRNYEVPEILATSFALITAIRIVAYYSEDLSKDVAKMLPFALLGLFLVDSTYFNMEEIMNRIASIPEFLATALQFILLLIITEWILRLSLTVSRRVIKYRHPKTMIVTGEKTAS